MRKLKFGINFAALWILLGIFIVIPFFILILIIEKSFEVLFSNNPPLEVVHAQV